MHGHHQALGLLSAIAHKDHSLKIQTATSCVSEASFQRFSPEHLENEAVFLIIAKLGRPCARLPRVRSIVRTLVPRVIHVYSNSYNECRWEHYSDLLSQR